jgi:hypothetical protein
MAWADVILALEILTLGAMAAVWCIHLWASPDFKKHFDHSLKKGMDACTRRLG